MAIAQQLQGESTEQNNTGQTVAVTLSAGSNRYMVVALVAERTTLAAPTSVTYGGNALTLITDGTVTASIIAGSTGGVFLYRLLEANMPSNGSNNLVVAWPGAATNYIMGWWILTGVAQANAADVKTVAETTTSTTITATLDAGATTDAVICATYKNDTTGTVAITISGAGVTEDFDVSLTTGGARGAAGTDLPAVASGTIACVATTSSNARRAIAAIRLNEAATSVDAGGSLTMGKPTLSGAAAPVVAASGSLTMGKPTLNPAGGGTIAQVGSLDQSLTNPRNVTVPSGANLLLVTIFGAFMAPRTGTYDGVALDVAYNSDPSEDNDEWVQFLYMIDPPVGTHELLLAGAGGGDLNWVCSFWSNVGAFDSALPADAASVSRTVTDGSLIIAGIQGTSGAHTAVAGATELLDDANGSYFAYRVEASAGTYSIGATSYSGPDLVSVVFTPAAGGGHVTIEDAAGVNASGSLDMGKPTLSGTATVEVVASGSLTMGKPTLSGTASPEVVASGSLTMGKPTLSASASPEVAASGSLDMGKPTLSGTALVQVAASGALDMGKPTLSGTVTLVVEINAGGSVTMGKPTLDGSATVELVAGGSLAMPVPTLSGSASPEVVAGGSLSMSVPTLAGSASIPEVADVGGSLTLGKPTLSGLVTVAVTAGGSLVMGKPTLDGRVVDPNAAEPRPGVFVTVVVPHGAASVISPAGAVAAVRAHGLQESKSPSGGVTVRRPRGGVS